MTEPSNCGLYVTMPIQGRRDHILLYTDDAQWGGVAQYNHALLCALATAGYEVTCVQAPAQNRLKEREAQLGVRHGTMGLPDLDFPAEDVVLVCPHFGRGAVAIVVTGQVVKEPMLGQAAGGIVKRLGHDAFKADVQRLLAEIIVCELLRERTSGDGSCAVFCLGNSE